MGQKKISIVIPYKEAESLTAVWAREEARIDFRKETERAARCTTAFAAVELKKYLQKTLVEAEVSFLSHLPEENFFISLRIVHKASKDDRYSIEPCPGGVMITGQGRAGLLYGAYELLHMQGWRWYAPGRDGEIAPEPKNELKIPPEKLEYAPDMSLGRGFYFEGVSKESSELWRWMARNRLNLATFRPATGPLGNKLGMIFRVGGHIFEAILDPDRMMPSGRTLWEEHTDWYGLPADGKRKKEKALATQFCVSQPDLLEFLGDELLDYLTGQWKEAEQVDIWGFDTWGSNCACEGCKSLGNGTDQTLFLLSSLRETINKARSDGRLEQDIKLVMCGYEGTSTISGPVNPFPSNLIEAGDYVTFFPINRCYAHGFTDSGCGTNKPYAEALKSWFMHKPHMPVMVGEYYNVSKYEDLPILFSNCMKKDFPDYYASGVQGMTYMHLPVVNWGMRTLTQLLYARLAWDINSDVNALLEEYFHKWYGPYEAEMRKVYELIEKAWRNCADWRNWGHKSVLTKLQAWDGAIPVEPMLMDNHFVTASAAVESGSKAIKRMQEAKRILDGVRARERQSGADRSSLSIETAANPLEAAKIERDAAYEMRLGEDFRLLLYGIDVMVIMTELIAYYDALYRKETDAAEIAWKKIEEVEEKLDSYYIPIGFESPGVGVVSRDALTRSQVRDLLRRIRKQGRGTLL